MALYESPEKRPNFPELEQRMLRLWADGDIFNKLRAKNADGERWPFMDGPITANNPMGVHHAWGRSLKDMFHRYHAMNGKNMRYQNGFDCQGLWVEVEVEKQLGFDSKRDIETYGVANFVNDCKDRVRKFSEVQTEQSKRLGYWMDWDNSYFTMSEENNYTIWSFLKRCFERGYIYKDFDVMPWCPRCEVGLSQMELHEGYKWVEHLSVFVRFDLIDRPGESLMVWTTTPWTLTANVAAAVNPEMEYVKVRAGDHIYYVGKDNYENQRRVNVEETTPQGKKTKTVKLAGLQSILKQHGEPEVLEVIKGEQMIGWTFTGPFDELDAQSKPGGVPYPNEKLMDTHATKCHRVIPWEDVSGSEGTGIVHIAPGCGKEDYELSKVHGLVAISPLNDSGHYVEGFGAFTGRSAEEVGDDIAASLKEKQLLVGAERYPHRYAHCWRCGTAIVYRLVEEWYIDMEWRDEIIKTVDQIKWVPDYGKQLELDWLHNMGDWMISKKRYWGLALPIWQCENHDHPDPEKRCDWFTVIGSKEELKAKALEGWELFDGNTPHRPWVDAVKIKCEKCGCNANRVPDVGNPWLDAGIVPYSTLDFRNDREHWEKWFPTDLVLECFPGQFRNWFYALLAMNTMMQDDRWADRTEDGESKVVAPFKTLLGHALVRDEDGQEMHKSTGNSIEFNAAAETIGADVMRYFYAAQNPSSNLNFPNIGPDRDPKRLHLDEAVMRKLLTWWNCYSFFVTYAEVDRITPDQLDIPLAERSELDRWVWCKYQRLVQTARQSFEQVEIHQIAGPFERFLDELSSWYLRRSRRRFWKSDSDNDKLSAYATLYGVLTGLNRLMAPILPFLTEDIYQNLERRVNPDAPESIHLTDYPQYDASSVDETLEARIDAVVRYKNLGLRLRNENNLKIRQPLGRLLVKAETEAETAALGIDELRNQLLEELNVKKLELIDSTDGLVSVQVKPNFKTLGPKYGSQAKAIQNAITSADAETINAAIGAGKPFPVTVDGEAVELTGEDVLISYEGPDNLAVLFEGGAFVALDTTIDEALAREGMARDFVRGVQTYRKDRELDVMDRIVLRYQTTDDQVAASLTDFADYIRTETLATEMVAESDLSDAARQIKVAGKAVTIDLDRVPTA